MSTAQAEAVARRWAGFIRSSGPAAVVRTRLSRVGPETFRRFDLRGFELRMEAAFAPDVVEFVGYDIVARMEWSEETMSGQVWTSAEDPETFAGIVENFFRALVAYRLAERGAVLLHSAAIVHGGKAFLFFGPSGAGKTTLSRTCLTAGDAVMSDDLNAVTMADGIPVALPLPFCGDLRAPFMAEPVPVGALCRLRQAPADRAEPLSPGWAVAALSACTPYVNLDPYRVARLLGNLDRLVRCCPIWVLSFTRGGLPWQALRDVDTTQ